MTDGGTTGTRGGYRPLGAVSLEATITPATGSAAAWRFAAAGEMRVEVALLAEDLARVRLLPDGREPGRSWAVARDDWPSVNVRADTGENDLLRLTTDAMRVEIAPDPFRVTFSWPDGLPFAEDDPTLGMGVVVPLAPSDLPDADLPPGGVRCYKRLALGERILGAGERTSPLDKRGERLIFWNTDPPRHHGADTRAMYASIPFWMGLREGRTYGIFVDSAWRTDLDAGARRPDVLSFGAAGGDLTYYVFAGPTPAAVLARYADLTGHMPLPPKWALGFGQSRWSYFPEAQLREVAEEFRTRHIPCDVLWLDIDYMDGYRVFTWSPRRYPEPERLLRELAEQGFRVVSIIDPGVKVDPTDETFADGMDHDYFVRRADGSLFTGVVWPGESAFPDFSREEVRRWWGERHRTLLDAGVAGIWDDMNEPSLTDFLAQIGGEPHGATLPSDALHFPDGPDAPSLPHAAFHNAYGMQMARATYEGQRALCPDRRPFVLTRSAYAGVQRYAALWTGDNDSAWPHLRLASRMCLALGLSGVPFTGFDSGGFWENTTGELLVRFTQLGSTFPFFRNHSALGTTPQEPWAFGQPYTSFLKDAIELRYRLLPYLYTTFAEAARTGAPIARPLAYVYPEEDALANVDDEHLLGGDLLAAPVMRQGALRRVVEFPRGAWVDWWTGRRFTGPIREGVDAPLDVLPLFAREGAIVPLGPVLEYVDQRPADPITLACYLGDHDGAEASGTLYEDDGETLAYQQGGWRLTRFAAARRAGRITFHVETPEGGYSGEPAELVAELHLPRADRERPAIASVILDGQSLGGDAYTLTPRRYETLLRVLLGRTLAPRTLEVVFALDH